MQSYAEYMTQAGFADPAAFNRSYNRTNTYCGLVQKPLQARRRRFVALVSTFLAVQLIASVALVVGVAVTVKTGRASPFLVRPGGCVGCDAWCAVNCSLLGIAANDRWSSRTFSVDYSRANATSVMCCIKRRDLLSKIYEERVPDQSETREKLFDGVRVTERWTEDDTNRWPKTQKPSINYSKQHRRFIIQSSGTYFVHSRIDFNCSKDGGNYYNQTIHVQNDSHPNSFEDNRIDLSKSDSAIISTIYTSSIDVMVELTKGEKLQMLTDPYNCTSPRSIVVYRLQDV